MGVSETNGAQPYLTPQIKNHPKVFLVAGAESTRAEDVRSFWITYFIGPPTSTEVLPEDEASPWADEFFWSSVGLLDPLIFCLAQSALAVMSSPKPATVLQAVSITNNPAKNIRLIIRIAIKVFIPLSEHLFD